MKTDPRAACENANELWLWAVVHDLVAHPLMALTNYARFAVQFHDWTSFHAWPRVANFVLNAIVLEMRNYGPVTLQQVAPDIWRVSHPNVSHTMVTHAADAIEALELAEAWFDVLAKECGGVFLPKGLTA